ncbi:MAG: hypothetical protein M5U23_13035 [Acidimicrobiia bacterium]|nr:hypothetical protein [Acidimicrobiia bacterium]
MKQLFLRLPGPIAVKVILATVLVIVALLLLNIIYNWMGTHLLDSGGGIE